MTQPSRPRAEARQFHRDQHARVLAMLRTYRAGDDRDLSEWRALIDDLTPPLRPAGDPCRVEELERFRRVVTTLLAPLALSSRLLDAASAEPELWLSECHEELLRRLADE